MIFSRLLQSITFPIIISASLVSCGYDLVTFGHMQDHYRLRYQEADASYRQYIVTATQEQRIAAGKWHQECSEANAEMQHSCEIAYGPYCDKDSSREFDTARGTFEGLMKNPPFPIHLANTPNSETLDDSNKAQPGDVQMIQYENQSQQGITNTVVPVIPPG